MRTVFSYYCNGIFVVRDERCGGEGGVLPDFYILFFLFSRPRAILATV